MSTIKLDFTKKGLRSETPKPVKIVYRIIMAISGLWLVVIAPNLSDYINEHVRLLIASIVGTASSAIYFICQFFHWKDSDEIDIDTEQCHDNNENDKYEEGDITNKNFN